MMYHVVCCYYTALSLSLDSEARVITAEQSEPAASGLITNAIPGEEEESEESAQKTFQDFSSFSTFVRKRHHPQKYVFTFKILKIHR